MTKGNYQELLVIASKPYLDRHDVCKLFACSGTMSSRLRHEFAEYFNDSNEGKSPVKPCRVPAKPFLEYFSYDMESLKKMAEFERDGLLNDNK